MGHKPTWRAELIIVTDREAVRADDPASSDLPTPDAVLTIGLEILPAGAGCDPLCPFRVTEGAS